MSTQLKLGLRNRLVQVLLAIIVSLIILILLQSIGKKKHYAKYLLEKSKVQECQNINAEQADKFKGLSEELRKVVGENTKIDNQLKTAEIKLNEYEYKSKTELDKRIEKLKSLPVSSCDDFVFSDTAIQLWQKSDN